MLLKVIITILLACCISASLRLPRIGPDVMPSLMPLDAADPCVGDTIAVQNKVHARYTWFVWVATLLMAIAAGAVWMTPYQRAAYVVASVAIVGAYSGRVLSNIIPIPASCREWSVASVPKRAIVVKAQQKVVATGSARSAPPTLPMTLIPGTDIPVIDYGKAQEFS
jgi:hypothetical protein